MIFFNELLMSQCSQETYRIHRSIPWKVPRFQQMCSSAMSFFSFACAAASNFITPHWAPDEEIWSFLQNKVFLFLHVHPHFPPSVPRELFLASNFQWAEIYTLSPCFHHFQKHSDSLFRVCSCCIKCSLICHASCFEMCSFSIHGKFFYINMQLHKLNYRQLSKTSHCGFTGVYVHCSQQ